jgi:hypothetical protein
MRTLEYITLLTLFALFSVMGCYFWIDTLIKIFTYGRT